MRLFVWLVPACCWATCPHVNGTGACATDAPAICALQCGGEDVRSVACGPGVNGSTYSVECCCGALCGTCAGAANWCPAGSFGAATCAQSDYARWCALQCGASEATCEFVALQSGGYGCTAHNKLGICTHSVYQPPLGFVRTRCLKDGLVCAYCAGSTPGVSLLVLLAMNYVIVTMM